MPCMMIGVPSHIVACVIERPALCFLGRADAVAAVPRTRMAKARVTILDGTLILIRKHFLLAPATGDREKRFLLRMARRSLA